MDAEKLRDLARELLADRLSIDAFLSRLDEDRSHRTASATIDVDRARRCGFPEVVYGEGKSPEALCEIFVAQLARGIDTLATRISPQQARFVARAIPSVQYNELARTLRGLPEKTETTKAEPGSFSGRVAVVTAGTSDRPVAEEARETLRWMGVEVTVIHDVGVAGPHRFVERAAELCGCDAVVVIAGMEGALPSVVGGYVSCPVIAVPTSIGYGASFSGVAALLGMLNSCASNVAVVNIDAGFKGAYVAGMIAKGRTGAAHSGQETGDGKERREGGS